MLGEAVRGGWPKSVERQPKSVEKRRKVQKNTMPQGPMLEGLRIASNMIRTWFVLAQIFLVLGHLAVLMKKPAAKKAAAPQTPAPRLT